MLCAAAALNTTVLAGSSVLNVGVTVLVMVNVAFADTLIGPVIELAPEGMVKLIGCVPSPNVTYEPVPDTFHAADVSVAVEPF